MMKLGNSTIGCKNSLFIGWGPHVFDPKAEWQAYLASKDDYNRRNGKKPGEQAPHA